MTEPARGTLEELQATLAVRNRQIDAVHRISRELSSTLDLEQRLKRILDVSMEAVDAEAGSILLHRASDNRLVFRYLTGPKAGELTGYAMDARDGVAGQVFQTGQALITNRPRESSSHRPDIGENVGFVTESMMTVPLKYQAGRPVGVMQILNKRHGEFTSQDLEVLEIVASIAATAIENAELHKDAQLAAVAHAVGDLSHDIKNKVTPISLAVDTLWPMMDTMHAQLDQIAAGLPAEQAARLEEAARPVREFYPETFQIIKEQVQEVQDYTKLIADAIHGIVREPQLDQHDLSAAIERQLDALEMAARSRGVTLVREIEPGILLRFDRLLIERAVYNLVNNAIPETPPGGRITVRARAILHGRFPEGDCVVIEVEDTGRGMPAHVLNGILTGSARSTKPGGTGLGTRIVRNAVLAHGGRFEGESREGKGTIFRIRLPLHRGAA